MSLENYAMQEFKAMGWVDSVDCWKDDMQKAICENVLAMLKVFSDGQHSGSTAPYALGMFKQLAAFKPLGPLTGEPVEWGDVGNGLRQNKRCSSVFLDVDGRAYNIDGKVFKEPNGNCYTNNESNVYIKFPYTPTTEYVSVPQKDNVKKS